MPPDIYTEADWRLFRKRLPSWQKAYMQNLLNEYAVILTSGDDPSDKFWALDERLRKDKRAVGVSAEMARSKLVFNLMSLLREGAISPDDLEGFSEPLKAVLMRSLSHSADSRQNAN